jgi:hypothetical protein
MPIASTTPLSEVVGDGQLSFDLIGFPKTRAVGVARRLTTKAGTYELHLVFERQSEFLTWIDNDEYRHQAQALFVRVRRRFDEVLRATESLHGTEPGTSR